MSGGGIVLDGQWLAVGTRVGILRDGYFGTCGVFKGKGANRKLIVNVDGTTIKLHLAVTEIRRVAVNQSNEKRRRREER